LVDASAASVCLDDMDKTNAADLSSGVFTVLISITRMIKIENLLT